MQSSIRYRPRNFDELVGQEKLIKLLRGQAKKRTLPNGMLFIGPKGSGKTTTARIVALSVQCSHQEFGNPCIDCRRRKSNMPIYELNCGRVRKVEDVENFIETANYDIVGRGKRKVFVFDEAHRLSGHAQDILLKPFEDKGKNLWIICSTKPEKIVDTLRSRCQVYSLKTLNREQTVVLVRRILKKLDSELNVDDLADALVDNGISSSRLITNACDKYVAGLSAEEAAEVEGAVTVDSKELIRSVVKGLWPDVSHILQKTSAGDIRLLRAAIIGYLRTVLLESSTIDQRSKAVAKAITKLTYINQAEDSNQLAALAAELFGLCELFGKYSL